MPNNTSKSSALLGYTNRLTVRPDEEIEFKISAAQDVPYSAQLVRLINGDVHSERANFKEVEINASINGEYTGREQAVVQGSCGIIDKTKALDNLDAFTWVINVMPTMPVFKQQHIISRWDETEALGWSLQITPEGQLAFSITDTHKQNSTVVLEPVLKAKYWYQVVVRVSQAEQLLELQCIPSAITATHQMNVSTSTAAIEMLSEVPLGTTPLIIAAAFAGLDHDGRVIPSGCFNGRLEAPVIYQGVLSDAELDTVLAGNRPASLTSRLVGDWDFSQGIGSTEIHDRSANKLNGYTHNLPARAVAGYHWDGSSLDWTQAPKDYAAIHFHSDDLYDCGWQTDIRYRLPADICSGIYALRLRQACQDDPSSYTEEYLPFFVAASKGKPQSRVAFIVPTFTYLAYGNTDILETVREGFDMSQQEIYDAEFFGPGTQHYFDTMAKHRHIGNSSYDRHLDGSPVLYASWLRPLLNMRPKSLLWNLGADLLFIDWLDVKGFEIDIITDDLLQDEGLDLLKDYAVVMSGNHPEYPTTQQLDALEAYTAQGGRFMYMGGNGYYWRLAVHNNVPAVVEIRRGRIGTLSVPSDIGECYLESTGEMGGLCRDIGRAPQRLVGVGFICSDASTGKAHYRVLPEARDSRAAFILEGVNDEVVGDFGILGGGAVGQEFDRTNPSHGTPEHTVILARSENHNLPAKCYAIEERILDDGLSDEFCESETYAELIFFETPKGGAVFSASSMSWFGSLSHNDYENNVSTITENVLRRFCDRKGFVFS